MNRQHRHLAIALALLPLSSACSSPDFDTCCECLLNTTPAGDATEDAAANCWDDGGDGYDGEVETCGQRSQAHALIGAAFDEGFNVSVPADGCREVCYDACAAVDDSVDFETPVVSAGECAISVNGGDVDIVWVTANFGPGLEANTHLVEVNAFIDDAHDDRYIFNLLALPEGAGQYAMQQNGNFGMGAPTPETGNNVESGTYNVSTFDLRTIAFTAEAVLAPTGTIVASCTADFTVNDGSTTNWVGLDAEEDGADE